VSVADGSPPKLSVALITYNHAAYIGACLDSVLAQRTHFPVEIVIGDDGSDDGSQDIIRDYARRGAERFPFRLLLSPVNRGNFANVIDILAACRGEYVALLEGDDRWCCEDKLQRQVDLLDAHPEYSGCFHDAGIVHDVETAARRGDVLKSAFRRYSQMHRYTPEITAWQLVDRVLAPTSALVYRNGPYLDELRGYAGVQVSLGEVLKLLVAKGGPLRYIDEVWAVHNNHSGGVTKTRSREDFFAAHRLIYRSLLRDRYYRRYRSHVYAVLADLHRERFWSGSGPRDGRDLRTLLTVAGYGLLHVLSLAREMSWGLPRRAAS
jgi:glycosyltransferase involved in cell wall biosynthesis